MKDSTKNLKLEIEAISLYGTGSLQRILQALGWWADDQGLRGASVSGLANSLAWMLEQEDALKDLLEALDVSHTAMALDKIDAQMDKIDSLEAKVEDLEHQLDECLCDKD